MLTTAHTHGRRCALAAALCAVGLAACGGAERPPPRPAIPRGSSLDVQRLERSIAAAITAAHGVSAAVSCPAPIPLHAGVVFVCLARLTHGFTPFVVTVRSDAGEVSYVGCGRALTACGVHGRGRRLLDDGRIESSIAAYVQRTRRIAARVACPVGIPVRRGLRFDCLAEYGGGVIPFQLVEPDDAGDVMFAATRSSQS